MGCGGGEDLARALGVCPCCGKASDDAPRAPGHRSGAKERLRKKLEHRRHAIEECHEVECQTPGPPCSKDHQKEAGDLDDLLAWIDGNGESCNNKRTKKKKRKEKKKTKPKNSKKPAQQAEARPKTVTLHHHHHSSDCCSERDTQEIEQFRRCLQDIASSCDGKCRIQIAPGVRKLIVEMCTEQCTSQRGSSG